MTEFNILAEEVKKEANNLRIHATKDERSKLSFNKLLPSLKRYCIYGQMTGNCYSERAAELIDLCAERLLPAGVNGGVVFNAKINGKPNKIVRTLGRPEYLELPKSDYYSPIEVFIGQYGNRNINNKILIDFIREESDSLDFVTI